MTQDKKHEDSPQQDFGDVALQLKKRARRRLIGAAALALFAAIVLPMVMDHQPAPPLKDIQVRIPSPDEGATARVVSPLEPLSRETTKPVTPSHTEVKPEGKSDKSVPDSAAPAPVKTDAKAEPKADSESALKAEAKSKVTPAEVARAQDALSGKETAIAWEVQLGAYRELGRVKLLVGKLKELGVATYTEKVDTPNGPRTRVRAGPYPTQEAAEKARERVKIVGVDGPVAKKP
jgi:DedD protein